MSDRYTTMVHRLRRAVLGGRGETEPDLRRAVEASSAAAGGRPESVASAEDVPEEIREYVGKVARHAYRVTDEDVAALRRAGWSEDALFEITVSAALGAGLGRLERGLAALKAEA